MYAIVISHKVFMDSIWKIDLESHIAKMLFWMYFIFKKFNLLENDNDC